MSHHIPFEMQSEIIKTLPVKSIIQFRSVSKQWKTFIDNPTFINNYHINHTNPQHHLFVSCELDDAVKTCTSIVDNNTFPKQKFPLTAPESLSSLRKTFIINSVNGLLCFCCRHGGFDTRISKVVIWNPTIRKSVDIVFPLTKVAHVVGFGVCPDTSDPKLVEINVVKLPSMWEVEVFTLSTRVWKTVYTGAPFKSCLLTCCQAFVDGVIYFLAWDDVYLDDGVGSNFVISFDLMSENFGEVCLPERLVHTLYLDLNVANVNGSLGLLEYYEEGDMRVCGVWTRKDDANKTFSKIYTVKVEGKSLYRVLGFSNNGEAVIELDADSNGESGIEVYEPLSGNTNCLGINGMTYTFCVRSYMETLLLLDETNAIIY